MVKLFEILKKENVVGPKDTWESIPYKPVKHPLAKAAIADDRHSRDTQDVSDRE